MSSSSGRRVAVLAALPLILAVPAAAHAAEVSVDEPILTYQAAPGEINRPHLSLAGNEFVVRDAAAGLTLRAGPGCRSLSAQEIRCRRPAETQLVDLRLGDRDDQAHVNLAGVPVTVRGEAGSDIYQGGTAPGISRVDFRGGSEIDLASYADAGSQVRVNKDEQAGDGRSGDRDNVRRDVENLLGSRFDDSLVGWANPEGTRESFDGMLGNDFLAGLGGSDGFEMRAAPEGADEVRGGDGHDYVDYFFRTVGVTVTLDHGADDDGQSGEGDDVREVEEAVGGRGDDRLEAAFGSTTPVTLWGLFGNDRLTGGEGDDDLIGEGTGGSGQDAINGRGGDDNIGANSTVSDPDFIDCGTGFDAVQHDKVETAILRCEQARELGTLKMATGRIAAEAGETARLSLRWKHPDGWKQLRELTVRLRGVAESAGEIRIRPRAGRVSSDGVKLVRSTLGHDGKWVSAELVVRVGEHLAGQTITADVEAGDVRGHRQVETGAARIRVAG